MFYYNYVDKCNQIGKAPSAAAEEMGFQRSVVTRWSNGAVPRQATLQKIADYFKCDVSDLLKEKTAAPEGDGINVNPRYFDLSPEDKATVDALIDRLSKAGQ